MLQAGPGPLFGDINKKDDLPAYRSVFAAVEPLMTDVGDAPCLGSPSRPASDPR